MKIKLVATCLFGLEHLLGEEINALGYERTETIDGRVYFIADEEGIALSNIFLRYAERVYILVGSFGAATFEELFEGTKALPWEAWIGVRDSFPVKGHSIRSALTSIPDCQAIIKKAVASRLGEKYSLSWLPEDGVKYQIEFFLLSDRADLMIDTSGVPLHKRGYRPDSGAAPIRETLAAAMAAISRPREDVLFCDPMCGSGTIPIEAAMLFNKIAPGRSRAFAAEAFPQIPGAVWARAREEAFDIEIDSGFKARASDIDADCVAVAEANVKRAGVGKWVSVLREDFRRLRREEGVRGTIVTNPPYGERLMTPEQAERIYREMGERFRALSPWQVYVITPHRDFERLYGRRADKVRKLYNGMIPCYLYQFFKKTTASDTKKS